MDRARGVGYQRIVGTPEYTQKLYLNGGVGGRDDRGRW